MKSLQQYLYESADETIQNEHDFREAAEKKFKIVFGDDLDRDRMNQTIKGILDDNPDLVKNNDWGELIGKLNASFAN